MTHDSAGATNLSCADCTGLLTRFQTGLLEETDAEVVREHLYSCPNCQLFTDQVDAVSDFVSSGAPIGLPDNLPDLPDGIAGRAAEHSDDLADIVPSLYRLAESLDPGNADDLVQQTLLTAFDDNRDLDLLVLARDLTDRALGDSGPALRSLNDYETRTESRSAAPDPDGDTAELFYPDFYDSGPDAGRHVNEPNRWGQTDIVNPDDEVFTADLYGAVDGAIGRLADPLGQLVQLVDIDDVSVADAARMLRLDQNDAVDSLHRARVHLRGVVDQYIAAG